MDELKFHPDTASDLEDAHSHCCDIWHAIEALQSTALWESLPLDTLRVLCGAHAHVGALEGALARHV